MKKTYFNPELQVVKLQTMQMLAASLPMVDPTETVEDINDLLGREANFDFEEEEFNMDEEEF